MIKIIENKLNKTNDLNELTLLAKNYMQSANSAKICDEVSTLIAANSDLNILENFIIILDTSEGINVGGHVVNISKNLDKIYDFTGDQYYGLDNSDLWIYKRISDKVYCSKDKHESDLPEELLNDNVENIITNFYGNNNGYRLIQLTSSSKIK